MSALIFRIGPNYALVAMDTLAVTQAGEPVFYTSKVYYLPHLHTIIAGLGLGEMICDFYREANSRMLLSGVENLSEHAPAVLRRLWSELKKTNPGDQYTTVYLFGLSERTGEIAAFVNRSTNNFISERFQQYGHAIKPPIKFDGEVNVETIPEIMEAIRAEEAKKSDPAKRIHIGGEIVLFALNKTTFMCEIIHKFPDADEHERQMHARHDALAAGRAAG